MKSKSFVPFIFTMLCGICVMCVPSLVYAGGAVGVPFDGGLSLLIAAGIGYGVKKAHDKRKKDRINNPEK